MPITDMDAAIRELDRVVKELKLKGVQLFGTDMLYDSEFGGRIVRLTIQSIERMAFSDSEKKMIDEDNAKKLLNLQSPCSPLS